MKTPDKIYVDYGLIDYHCLDEQKVNSIEYIRKNAILEWLKEEIQIMRESNDSPAISNAKMDVVESLLDKIESI